MADDLVCDGRGWYKTYRQLDQWEWYKDSHMVHLFIHLLNKANFEDKRWEGITVKRGQFITSLDSLSSETGISRQTVRTCLNKLKSTHEITQQSTHRYTIITITKYNTYQSGIDEPNTVINTVTNTRLTHHQHTTNTNEEVKNKRSIIMPPFFEDFWKVYPTRNGHKVGKAKTLKLFASLPDGDKELIVRAAANYAKSKTAKDGYAKDPERFLKDDYWKDWIETKKEDSDFL